MSLAEAESYLNQDSNHVESSHNAFRSDCEGAEDEIEVIELDDGGSHTFKERSEDMGSWQAVRKVLTIEAKGEGEEDLWSRDCEGDCQGVHGVLHYTVHPTEKEFRLKARDGKEI